MDPVEVVFSPLCYAIGLGIAVLYHLVCTKRIRRNLAIQLHLLQNMPLGFVYVEKGHVLVNKTFCLFLGIKRLNSWQDFLDLFPVAIQNTLTERCSELRENREPFEETILFEKRAFRVRGSFLTQDGFILWWTDMTAPRKKVLKENQKNKHILCHISQNTHISCLFFKTSSS